MAVYLKPFYDKSKKVMSYVSDIYERQQILSKPIKFNMTLSRIVIVPFVGRIRKIIVD